MWYEESMGYALGSEAQKVQAEEREKDRSYDANEYGEVPYLDPLRSALGGNWTRNYLNGPVGLTDGYCN